MLKHCGKDAMRLSPSFSMCFQHLIGDKWCLGAATRNQQDAAFMELFQVFKDVAVDIES